MGGANDGLWLGGGGVTSVAMAWACSWWVVLAADCLLSLAMGLGRRGTPAASVGTGGWWVGGWGLGAWNRGKHSLHSAIRT